MSSTDIYPVVMDRLKARLKPQRVIATDTGIPYSTLTKIAQGVNEDPSVHTIQKLYNYFLGIDSTVNPEKQPKTESIASVECCSGDPRHGERRKPELHGRNDRRGES